VTGFFLFLDIMIKRDRLISHDMKNSLLKRDRPSSDFGALTGRATSVLH